jgi:hypothetical protein
MINEVVVTTDLNGAMREIRARLGDMQDQAPNVLRNAINTTARKVRRKFVQTGKAEYQLSDTALLQATKAMQLRTAKKSDLTARLTSEGGMNDLMKFMVAPGTTLAHGINRPDYYMAHVLKSTGYVSLTGKPKPFVTQFKSGHIAIVVRVPGKTMKSDHSKTFIKKLLSPSVPHMLGNEKTREQAEALYDLLMPLEIEHQIDRVLSKKGI